jgi:hypothetical protein
MADAKHGTTRTCGRLEILLKAKSRKRKFTSLESCGGTSVSLQQAMDSLARCCMPAGTLQVDCVSETPRESLALLPQLVGSGSCGDACASSVPSCE